MTTTQTGLANLSLAQMVELYNTMADKPVKKFSDKGTAMLRLQKMLDESGMEVFRTEEGDWDVRVSSTEVDPTEDTEPEVGDTTTIEEHFETKRSQGEARPKVENIGKDHFKVTSKPKRGRMSPLLGKKLTVVRKENPKRRGTATWKRYPVYSECRTSDEFMEKCLERGLGSRREILSDLAWDSSQEFIRLS